jgi:hypothetical protein
VGELDGKKQEEVLTAAHHEYPQNESAVESAGKAFVPCKQTPFKTLFTKKGRSLL